MRFKKVYVEITNVCNLSCVFCPGTKRKKAFMTAGDFETAAKKLRPFTDHIYPHLMGEPLCHPEFPLILDIAEKNGFNVIITTNGTLLSKQEQTLLESRALKRVNISLHSFEATAQQRTIEEYLYGCLSFAKKAEGKTIIFLRLWNNGGMDAKNEDIKGVIAYYFPLPWTDSRNGAKIGENVFIEYGSRFDWPDIESENEGENVFCYGLRDQIGILCDGTVVPCCLDSDGNIPLGNIFTEELEDILQKPRATALYNGFSARKAAEELCRKCGYAKRFG
ncbi:MAG: SPASM domain-containing protein [Clostridia bacterium]|nr:SPASM domain-containing protein [Clostridia bacterium]